ncbi:MAG TPA: UDP-2,3-diacylglucosamine diphosphatase LpxG [Parachlamydiaceae bacterium]|nr:UDP-2,3-diacylglucosamine diphosphatase LpxG [Parachlamydiaceae bacterium]
MDPLSKKSTSPLLWDLFCTSSLIGIWPRFIEPRLIFTTCLNLPIPNLSDDLAGFKILQISDIHFNNFTSEAFLNKLIKKCEALKPDLIVMTGDFICYSNLDEPERLKSFLQRFHAPYGCYAVLGNHDYASFVSVNDNGDYDIIDSSAASSSLSRAFLRLAKTTTLTKTTTEKAKNTPFHLKLMEMINDTPFKLLHNETSTISVKNTKLNICGLGEYCLKKINTDQAFKNYDEQYPGILLLHNPDGAPSLKDCPGDVILSGHTHGGQVNLPWMWKKFTLLENMKFKKGLVKSDNKWIYINRGLGSVLPFRWFSPPEILLLTLETKR